MRRMSYVKVEKNQEDICENQSAASVTRRKQNESGTRAHGSDNNEWSVEARELFECGGYLRMEGRDNDDEKALFDKSIKEMEDY